MSKRLWPQLNSEVVQALICLMQIMSHEVRHVTCDIIVLWTRDVKIYFNQPCAVSNLLQFIVMISCMMWPLYFIKLYSSFLSFCDQCCQEMKHDDLVQYYWTFSFLNMFVCFFWNAGSDLRPPWLCYIMEGVTYINTYIHILVNTFVSSLNQSLYNNILWVSAKNISPNYPRWNLQQQHLKLDFLGRCHFLFSGVFRCQFSERVPPRKLTWQTEHPPWMLRCISYWKWGFSSQSC